ncbi:hypothetical protein CL614_06180 [archaeon]|nr:hypothetical protein [archaeon]
MWFYHRPPIDGQAWSSGCGMVKLRGCRDSSDMELIINGYDFDNDGIDDTTFDACQRVLGLTDIEECFDYCCQPITTIPDLPKDDGKTWVEVDPIQCLGNPWEIDWLESHNNNYSAYPIDVGTLPNLETTEGEIIKNYYQNQGINIFNVISKSTYDTVCKACSCAKGYTLYLLISELDINKMLEFGYKINAE